MPVQRRFLRADVITGAVFLAISLTLFWASQHIREFAAIGVGSAFVPRLTAALLLVVAIAVLIDAWRQGATAPIKAERQSPSEARVFAGLPAVALSVGLMGLYLALLEPLGFLPASALYGFAQMLILAKDARRTYFRFALLGLLPAAGFYYLFVNVFDISLPAGLLG